MYTIYPALADEQIAQLIDLKNQLPMVESLSYRRRMGENGVNNLSEYFNSRSFAWTMGQRKQFKANFPEKQWAKSLVMWFLELPPKTGFLDRMTYWVGFPNSGTVLVYALNGDQTILIQDQEVVVPHGTGIGFNLSQIHEIKPSAQGQLWACSMVLGNPEAYKP